MSQVTLNKMGCYNRIRILLENASIYGFAFNVYPTYPSLVHEFLASYFLRTHHFDEQNPMNNIRFRLGGRDRFLTSQEFDSIFGFKQGGLASPNSSWQPKPFWIQHSKPNANSNFKASKTKASNFTSKSL